MELLAPAGNTQKLRFALAYGADAVYAGQPQYSLRARENSFVTPEDIAAAIDYTHGAGKKFYLASNIIPHNNKIAAFQKSLGEYIEMKPDALIMSDPGIIHYVRKNYPHQEIHLSVQANCTNWSTAEYWKEMGLRRIIVSRELNLREISEIHSRVPGIELEVFVHGAICMAYSGRCLLSNYMDNRASNQGACSNACRYNYQLYARNSPQSDDYIPLKDEFYLRQNVEGNSELMLVDEDKFGTYIMNSKDMCAIEHLDKIRDAGVVSVKIEGRTKSLYYLAQAVRSYRGALDDLEAGRPLSAEHVDNIRKLDSRGTIPGFFIPSRGQPQNYETTRVRSETAKIAAFVKDYDSTNNRAILSVKGTLKTGDRLELATPKGSRQFHCKDLRDHKGRSVPKVSSGLENASIVMEGDPGPFAMLLSVLDGAWHSTNETQPSAAVT